MKNLEENGLTGQQIKLSDIAKMVGVSKTAVSLAINNRKGISKATRERILDAIRSSGFTPRFLINRAGLQRSLKAIRFLACIRDDVVSSQYKNTPFFLDLIHGVENECRSNGYDLIFSTLHVGSNSDISSFIANEMAEDEPIVILGTNLSKEEVLLAKHNRQAIVVLDALLESADVDCIVMNNLLGAYDAMRYLRNLGHRSIGYVQSKTRIDNFEQRKRGFLLGARESGINLEPANVLSVSPDINKGKEEVVAQMANRAKGDMPTAFFCENDYIAIAAIKGLEILGARVPEDVSIIGFDNIPQSTVISPELTTINVEKREIGSLAVRRVLEIAQGLGGETKKIIVNTTLVERKSCRRIE